MAPAAADGGEDGLMGSELGDAKWWPPGFRFHPTDEELVLYYLKRKICGRRLRLHMIGDVDVYKWEPCELPEKSLLKSGDKQWYFFSPRDRKYPNGSRCNRATKYGYWKATGKDRTISQNSKAVGNKKTLVYYQGRAPKGERTDWVMHEYTLDEQVLMRCNNVQDSYALYKVFRKSGPGPKNGEQYGALFREEEWEEDGADGSFRNQINFEDPTREQLHSAAPAGPIADEVNILPIGELEDLLLQLSNEQDMIQQLSECSAYVSEIDVGAEVGSHALVSSSVDATSINDNDTWCELSSSVQMSFHPDNVQPSKNPEITSLNSCPEEVQVTADEEFLEIGDFNDPESLAWNVDDVNDRGLLHGTDLLYDHYDYFDAPMFLHEAFEPLNGATQNLYFNDFGVDGRLNEASHVTTELWTHEQAYSMSTAAEPNHNIVAPPPLGIVYDSTSSNLRDNTQGQISPIRDASPSWFGSAVSALLDSVPSRPAIASERALISRALERVSSFKSGQIGVREPNAARNGGTAVSGRRTGGHNGGFLFISFLVALGAVLWVLGIGAVVKVIKGLWGRFISS